MGGLTPKLLVLLLITVGEGIPVLLEQRSNDNYHSKDVVRLLQNFRPMKSKSLFLLFPQRVTYEHLEENPGTKNFETADSIDEYHIPSMIQKRKDDEKSDIGKRVYLARIGKRQFYAARIG